MSKLIVEVCRIEKLEALENAQKLEMATIKGWQALVGKDQHHVGELVIFVPPDTVVPQSLAEALKLGFLRENGRLKTIKLRGYISQGLVLSFAQFVDANLVDNIQPSGSHVFVDSTFKRPILLDGEYKEGDDVAEALGIIKYEPPQKSIVGPKKEYIRDYWAKYLAKEITLRRFVAKSIGIIQTRLRRPKLTNEHFKVYTDINNVKHYPTTFQEGENVIITEKIHGTNFRAGNLPVKQTFLNKLFKKSGYEFCYGSHKVQKTCLSGKGFYGEDVYGQIAARYGLRDLLPNDYVLYGEIYGPNIQKGFLYGTDKLQVVFFDLKINGVYQDWYVLVNFCKERNLPIVPTIYIGEFQQSIMKETEGKSLLAYDNNGDVNHIREGIIIKTRLETNDPRLGRKILKSISTEYLLTKDEDNAEFSH